MFVAAPAATMLVIFTTVLTCVAIGTNLWKVCSVVEVDSTKNPKF